MNNQMIRADRHLDLGSGPRPRNPLLAESAIGLDLRGAENRDASSTNRVIKWNAVNDQIPFPDNSFSSCSAFDFFEHVPRIWPSSEQDHIRYPFVDLMSEIFRVLQPGGVLLAATPVYPARDAFSDPTHVNFLTLDSHRYFCGPQPWAEMYGFEGLFESELVEVGLPHFLYAELPPWGIRKAKLLWRRVLGQQMTHLLWRFKAVKF